MYTRCRYIAACLSRNDADFTRLSVYVHTTQSRLDNSFLSFLIPQLSFLAVSTTPGSFKTPNHGLSTFIALRRIYRLRTKHILLVEFKLLSVTQPDLRIRNFVRCPTSSLHVSVRTLEAKTFQLGAFNDQWINIYLNYP